jgi:predicted O-methyltransferase YrrM
MSDRERWAAVDRYLGEQLIPADPAMDAALDAAGAAGLPRIEVTPAQGRLLELLVRLRGARTVLELGTLGGYSTIWMARALPPGGRLTSLELHPGYAAVARENLARAGVADRVEVRVGPAQDSLAELAADGAGPFDFIFIDADKASYAGYLTGALALSAPGTLIVADNVIRNGAVADPGSPDANVQGVRRFFDRLAAEPGLRATAVQTVGAKGYDGFALALVEAR